jgi:EAL domain-containing protein (putative c-di-GMP-specific phosphodiesterase class I)
MFRAKAEGGGFRNFTEDMFQENNRRTKVENELREALGRNELHVYYQPEVDLQNGNIVGAEALVRWLSPSGEMVSPSEFIPLAEEMGIIEQMSEHVLRTVCFQMKKWCSSGFSPFRISVNISSRLLSRYDLSSTLSSLIEETGVAPESLDLEISESAAVQNLDQALKTIWKLNGLSFRVTMDDFGSSYSSLMCFLKFPLNLLKIDRKFISDLECSPEDQTIVKAIIAMANALDIKVLAKGVEREGQVKMLKDFGCRLAQGYYFGHPVPADEFAGLLEKRSVI